MIIEVTGSLGSGKSALTQLVARQLAAEGIQARVVRAGGSPSADFRSVPWAPVFALRNARLARLIALAAGRDADSFRARQALRWNMIRKAGVHERLTGRSSADLILWDEGTIHMAHNAFAHIRRAPRREEVLEFGEIVPKPDLIVLVQASPDVALRRVLARGHKRTGGDASAVEAMLENAGRVFSYLAQVGSIRERLILVVNDSANLAGLNSEVKAIVDRVRMSGQVERQ